LVRIKDLIIVETKDALLICKKGRSRDVKKIVEKLEAEKISLISFCINRFPFYFISSFFQIVGNDIKGRDFVIKSYDQHILILELILYYTFHFFQDSPYPV